MTQPSSFRALVVDDTDDDQVAQFRELTDTDLPDHDVLVEVEYSSLNYKDGLVIAGPQKMARRTPLVAGADLAGTVLESSNPDWKPGDRVVVNGWGLSETQSGGYTRRQRVKPEWLVRIPDAFSTRDAMAIYSGSSQPFAGDLQAIRASSAVSREAASEVYTAWMEWLEKAGRANAEVSQQLIQCRSVKQVAEVQRQFVSGLTLGANKG